MSNHHHQPQGNLKIAFLLNVFFTIFEFIGGWYVNSIAIMSDAVHDLGDSVSLGIAWLLAKKSTQKANKTFSFGYYRFSLLGAFINSMVLIAGSVYVITEAINRLIYPEYSNAKGMFWFAVVGIIVNGYGAWKVSKGKSLNEKVIIWHLLEDVLGWVAVLIVAIIMHFYSTPYLDPILSLLITVFILYNVVKRLKETMIIFLQGKPKNIDYQTIENKLQTIPGVDSIHHLHIWSLDGEHNVVTVHVKTSKNVTLEDINALKSNIKQLLSEYSFSHITVEIDFNNESCSIPSSPEH